MIKALVNRVDPHEKKQEYFLLLLSCGKNRITRCPAI